MKLEWYLIYAIHGVVVGEVVYSATKRPWSWQLLVLVVWSVLFAELYRVINKEDR